MTNAIWHFLFHKKQCNMKYFHRLGGFQLLKTHLKLHSGRLFEYYRKLGQDCSIDLSGGSPEPLLSMLYCCNDPNMWVQLFGLAYMMRKVFIFWSFKSSYKEFTTITIFTDDTGYQKGLLQKQSCKPFSGIIQQDIRGAMMFQGNFFKNITTNPILEHYIRIYQL